MTVLLFSSNTRPAIASRLVSFLTEPLMSNLEPVSLKLTLRAHHTHHMFSGRLLVDRQVLTLLTFLLVLSPLWKARGWGSTSSPVQL